LCHKDILERDLDTKITTCHHNTVEVRRRRRRRRGRKRRRKKRRRYRGEDQGEGK